MQRWGAVFDGAPKVMTQVTAMGELITVATFMFPYQAEMARLKLESEGIECFIADEVVYRTIEVPLLAGGIKLRVREEDAERAARVLEEEQQNLADGLSE